MFSSLLPLLPTSRAFCSAGIPCYCCPAQLLIKDRKPIVYSKADPEIAAGTEVDQGYVDEDIF